MSYCISRVEKVKDRAQITAAAQHNLRLRFQPNIVASRTPENKVLVNTLDVSLTDASDLQKKLTEYYASLDIKERSDNVLMLEFIVSASPEFFVGKSKAEIKKWADQQVEFMKKEFGVQLKLAVIHFDETSPHIHFMISTEQKTIKRFKNRYGEGTKETWSLNAKRYNQIFLRDFHDRHAEANKPFGLKRGVRGSMRNHTTLKEFYSLVEKAMGSDYEKEIEKVIDTLETGILSNKVSIDEVREKFAPMLNKLIKQNKALKTKFEVDIKEWAANLAGQAETLELEREAVAQQKNHYGKGLKKIADLETKNQEQARLIEAQRLQIEHLKPKQNLTRKHSGYAMQP